MEKRFIADNIMDISKLYFHGLFFWNDKNSNYLEKVVLDSILKYGKIFPRTRLREILTVEEQISLLHTKPDKFNFNGMEYVSVASTEDTYNNQNKSVVSQSDRAFPLYCAHNISIIISPMIIWDYECYGFGQISRESHYMNGEIQVHGSISKDYFQGISYYQAYSNSCLIEMIENGFLDNEVANDLLNLTEDKFLEKYFYKQIMIENLLSKYGYKNEIFNIETRRQCPSIEEEKEIIQTLKKMIK